MSAVDFSRKSFTVAELAERLGGELRGDGALRLTGVNAIDAASPSEVTFVSASSFLERWKNSRAGAAVVSHSVDGDLSSAAGGRPLIVVRDAEMASIALLELFSMPEPVPPIGLHPTAWVHPTAKLGNNVRIGPHVSIESGVVIDNDAVLHAGVRLYEGVVVGLGAVLHANTVIRHACRIGRGVIIHQNVSIGADGFGYRPDAKGGGLLKMPHLGNVIIEDYVEIGANTCIDRAKFGSTVIGAGTKIDNLVQIGHNTIIGRCCVIAGCVGVSGSVKIGDWVQVGGAVGISDHVSVGTGAKIGGMAFVMQDVAPGATVLGHPANEAHKTLRQWASVRKLPELLRKLSGRPEGEDQPTRRPHRNA